MNGKTTSLYTFTQPVKNQPYDMLFHTRSNTNWTSYVGLALGFVLGCMATLCVILMQGQKKHRSYYRIPNGEEVDGYTLMTRKHGPQIGIQCLAQQMDL